MGSSDTVTMVNNSYYPTVTDGSSWSGGLICREISAGASVPMIEARTYQTINKKEEVRDMRGLYEIWVIDPDEEVVVFYLGGKNAIVADDSEMAKLIAARGGEGAFFGKVALRKYHYYARKICDVPKPKEVQEVRIVKEA